MPPPRLLTVLVLGAALGCAAGHDARLVREREARLFRLDERTPQPAAPAAALAHDLDAYVLHGLRSNGALRAAFEEWRASLERVEQAGTLPDPRLTYGEFLEEVQTRTGPQERRVGLSQTFPWPGKLRTAARRAGARSEMLWQRVETQRLEVVEGIAVAYHEYAFLATNARITREILELLQQLEPVVQGRIQAGGKQEDLLRLQVEIGRLENELAGLEQVRPALSARLAAAMNLDAGGLLPEPELAEPSPAQVAAGELLQRALERNPGLAMLRAAQREAAVARRLAGYAGRPDVTLGVDWFQTGEALSTATPGSGDDPVAVTLSLNLPVWRGSYAAARREAEHAERAVHARLADAEFQLRARVEAEAYRLGDAARQLVLYRDSLLPRARETYELTLASYRAGDASLLDLIDSERARLEFEMSYWRASRDHHQARARLASLVGGPIR